ncbi:hypothetical protein JCM33774_20040 [Actinophytocola sp. KF-1]
MRMPGAFPYLPGQSGYNRRLRAALPVVKQVMRWLATDTDIGSDPVWVVDSTPGGMRPVPTHSATFSTGRVGHVRLLPITYPAGSGACACI